MRLGALWLLLLPSALQAQGDPRASLSAFLARPVGVMRMVLVTHVRLDLRERDSVVVLLERLDAERRARQVRFAELPHAP